jgi:hypothetical protein
LAVLVFFTPGTTQAFYFLAYFLDAVPALAARALFGLILSSSVCVLRLTDLDVAAFLGLDLAAVFLGVVAAFLGVALFALAFVVVAF